MGCAGLGELFLVCRGLQIICPASRRSYDDASSTHGMHRIRPPIRLPLMLYRYIAFAILVSVALATPDEGTGEQRRKEAVSCLDGDEMAFLQRLPNHELFFLGELVGVVPSDAAGAPPTWSGGTLASTSAEWESVVIESVRCLPTESTLILRQALAELGFMLPPPHAASCSRRLHRLRQQMVSASTRRCTPRQLMKAVRDGYRPGKDEPFKVQGCQVQWYSPEEACRVIQDSGGLALVGDSLMRSLAVALIVILSGNYESATSWRTSRADPMFMNCDCDAGFMSWTDMMKAQFDIYDKSGKLAVKQGDWFRHEYCRVKSMVSLIMQEGKQEGNALREIRHYEPSFCPSWERMQLKMIVESEPVHDDSRMAEDDAGLLEPVDVDGYGTVIANGGLHFRKMNDRVIQRVFHRPEFKSISRRVCMTVHAPGSNKQEQFLPRQGLAQTQIFNEMIRNRACLDSNDFVLESFSLTRNASSYDGTHYYQEPNVLLAQLLLNALDGVPPGRAQGGVPLD